MATSSGIISAPLSIEDIRRTLGTSSSDLGTLCTHANVNKWSRKKPVRYATPQQLTDAQFKSVSYGMVAPPTRVLTVWDATKTDMWTYNKPRGSVNNEYYRQTDFVGYCHTCVAPGKVDKNLVYNRILMSSISIKTFNGFMQASYNLTFADLTALANYYLCIIFTRPDGEVLYKTSDNTIGASDMAVTPVIVMSASEFLTAANGDVWDYYICAFSAKKNVLMNPMVSGTFLALPCESAGDMEGKITIRANLPITFSITGIIAETTFTSTTLFISATKYVGLEPINTNDSYYLNVSSTYSCSVKCTLKNTSNYEVTLNSNLISVRLNQTYASTSEVGNFPLKAFKDANFNDISLLTLKAGESATVYIAFPNDIFRMYSSGTTITQPEQKRLKVTIYVNYNNINKQGNFPALRIRNYS